ncbi:hypothetical protein EJB05_17301, partial [Eragrostis curvula]
MWFFRAPRSVVCDPGHPRPARNYAFVGLPGTREQRPANYGLGAGRKVRKACLPNSLDPAKVNGKIVVCVGTIDRAAKGRVVKEAGGVGIVLCNDELFADGVLVDAHIIPAAHCSFSQCARLFSYLRSASNPTATITTTDVKFGVKPAPEMAAFSSRGPNAISPQILKTASSYSVTAVEHPAGVKVTVQPDKLYLGVEETKEFEVKLDVVNAAAAANYVFGSFEWSDGLHRVRSPVVVKTTC